MENKNVLTQDNVFVVSVCRNEQKYISVFINSLLDSSYPIHIVIIDNNSGDGTLNSLKSYERNATILYQKENLGFGIANNLGIQYALEHNADYIFLLNTDMVIERNTIETLLNFSKKNPDFAIISPICLNYDKNKFESMFFESITYKNRNFSRDARLFLSETFLHRPFSKELYETTYINAAHWFMPSNKLKTLGGFNPVFYPIYGEDEEFLNRIARRGYKIGFTPCATVYHDTESREPSSLDPAHFYCINFYITILNSNKWCTYYSSLILLFLRICKNILLLRKENLKQNYWIFFALIHWRKILRKTWVANQKNSPIDFYTDLSQIYRSLYLKKTN